ncbi:MAG: hypothetical protein MK188_07635, partial [Gammaproteobacteria bacterium]|nr:hypothetical protein [Gammaproteobacteria bacterium]
MGGDLWAIKDPVVSWDVFMPGFREFRYELFENSNILWSNLRGMGQPILGNGVQGAPLFPLSLVLIWLPDQLFWSIMPITRVVLISLMLFLTARNIFKMPLLAALIFAILAGYNINVMRWINHPWTNGALSGVWYYYFLVQVTFAHEHTRSRRILHTVGLVVGVIGMITNGFPEASALFALLTMLLYVPICIAKYVSLRQKIKETILRVVCLHLIGFGLCSVQIIALLEYINYTKVLELRSDFISGAWSKEDAKPYFLSQLTVLERTELQRHYIRFTAGAVGTFLALQGFASLVLDRKHHSNITKMVGIGFVFSMLLFLSKNFALSDAVNWLFANTPVLSTSHFPLYFTPLFYFGSAYFAALAITSYWQNKPDLGRLNHALKAAWVLISLYVLIRAINSSAFLFLSIPPSIFWKNQLNVDGYHFISILIGLALCIFAFHLLAALQSTPKGLRSQGRAFSLIICYLAALGVGLEQDHTVEAKYSGNENHLLFRSDTEWIELSKAIEQTELPLHELRTRDPSGFYVEYGLATLDNGVSAMLPPNQRLVRRTLYDAPYGGYLPLQDAYFPWSGWLLSNNLTTVHSTIFSDPDWSKYSSATELNGKMLSNPNGFTGVKLQNPTKFWGWVSSYTLPHHSRVWGKFDDGENQRWMEANIADTKHKTVNGKVLTTTGWRFLIPIHE